MLHAVKNKAHVYYCHISFGSCYSFGYSSSFLVLGSLFHFQFWLLVELDEPKGVKIWLGNVLLKPPVSNILSI